jgi:hypothetical protein
VDVQITGRSLFFQLFRGISFVNSDKTQRLYA